MDQAAPGRGQIQLSRGVTPASGMTRKQASPPEVLPMLYENG